MTETAASGIETSRPTSTLLTFLIADVRGYTRFTNDHGDEAAARLADRFAGICEAIVGAHDGRVIELRGDEALAVFASAREALRGAVALQQAFRQAIADDPSLPLKVGMGLDAGEPIAVRGGYRGGALNLAARLCSIAGAGEILASEGVIHLARKTEGLVFCDRGQVTLKGLAAPVRVLQIAPEGELPDELPPLQPILVTHPTNLPDEPTPFIGREQEIDRIAALLRDPHIRLVTLTGPGGTGKTRLALQVGNTLLYDFEDGVFFCGLASLSDPSLVPTAIAEVLQIKEDGARDLIETLVDGLTDKHLLLVLDNFEHVLAAAPVVAQLLDGCRTLNILVTSRIPLRLRREHEHAVPPLAVPDPLNLPDVAGLSQYESVALFIERAKAAKDSFEVTSDNAPAVAEICSRLDGLPLAIELAAARIKLFPPQALLQRLSSRLKVLTGGARDAPERQRTLRGAIDWSHSLLTEDEQTLFTRLSVFVGGCTFEAAEAVCNGEGDLDLFEGLASLVEKSLIRQQGEDEPRFSMLETIREYAAEKLAERGEEAAVRDAYGSYFVQLTEEAAPEILRGPRQMEWKHRLDADLPNIRAAIAHLLSGGRVEDELRIICALSDYWVWKPRGVRQDILRRLEEGVERLSPQSPVRLRGLALFNIGRLILNYGLMPGSGQEYDGRQLAEAYDLLEQAGDRFHMARTAVWQGRFALWSKSDYPEAETYFQRVLALYGELGDERGMAFGFGGLAYAAFYQEQDERAIHYWQEALTFARRAGDSSGVAMHLFSLGVMALWGHGDLEVAKTYLEECLALNRELPVNLPGVQSALGALALKEGDFVTARHYLRESLIVGLEEERAGIVVETLEHAAGLQLALGEPERAGRLLGAAAALRERHDLTMDRLVRPDWERTVRLAHEMLGEEAWRQTEAEGAGMSLEAAVAYALSCIEL